VSGTRTMSVADETAEGGGGASARHAAMQTPSRATPNLHPPTRKNTFIRKLGVDMVAY
jgi:hypothetical protein